MAESIEQREQLARLDADMQHLRQGFKELKEEFRQNKSETKAELLELRKETREGFTGIKREIDAALNNFGNRVDQRINEINNHVNECSKTNGRRISNLEHDQSHAKGITRGAVAVISMVAAAFGALAVAVAKAFLQ